MQISDKGIDFNARQEGVVLRAYRDQGGVPTIGQGFTNASKIAVSMLGPIRMGMTITREQNDRVVKEAMNREYGPAVSVALPAATQPEFDAAADYAWNCGTGSMNDSWVSYLKTGHVTDAARKLLSSRATVKGVPNKGLARRREVEAHLILTGDYGAVWTSRSTQTAQPSPEGPDEELLDFQKSLNALGFPCGTPDGWHGPQTTAAIMAFQKNQPNLTVDGILGPATKAAIQRAIAARAETKTGGSVAGAIVVAVPVGASVAHAYWPYVLIFGGIGLLLVLALLLWRWRDEIVHRLKG